MVVLETHGIGVAFAAPVLSAVTLKLTPGWYGLVGANGAGKTTLLRVLAGELAPSEGFVRVAPDGASIVLCPQDVDALSTDVRAFADASEAAAPRGRLALDPETLERWDSLSPGERKRWQIGAALARDPDILLLDEPTNHLDGAARRLLVEALRRHRGIGLVVSHDRELLDELPVATLRVHDALIRRFPGGYGDASRAWQEERAAKEEAHARAKSKVRVAAKLLDDARREHASVDRARSMRSHMKSAQDHDARDAMTKGRIAFAEKRAGRVTATRRAALDRAERDVPRTTRDRTLGSRVFATFERAPSPVIMHVDRPVLSVNGHEVLRDVRLTITREDRVRIAGRNGSGKTTLLRALLDGRSNERFLYLPQELTHGEIAGHVATLRSLDPEARGRVLSVFAALGSDPERLLVRRDRDAASLSPGEARKLVLASGLGRQAWALVLDEPTNHMDLPSVERLEEALAAYPGCVVLVTHDETFADRATHRTLHVEDGTVR